MDPEGLETWAFICECGEPDCVATVALTQAQFQQVARHGPVVAEGHGPERS